MRVGRLFTYNGQRFPVGSDFPIGSLPEYRRDTFIRLYELSEQPPAPRKRKKKEKAGEPLTENIPVEQPENGETDE